MTTAEKLLKIDEGVDETIALNVELEQTLYGTDTGGKSHYDEFWDAYQENGNRTNYRFAFAGKGWNEKFFKPKYDMNVSDSYEMFRGTENNLFVDLTSIGVSIDFSNSTDLTMCFHSSGVLKIGTVDVRGTTKALAETFAYSAKLHTIEKIITKEDGSTKFAWSFTGCDALENLIIEGTLGQDGFDIHWSTKLSKISITSIVNALSTTTSGLTVTLSKTAVNKAFETSEGAADGSTSAEWLALIGTRSNWTISLV